MRLTAERTEAENLFAILAQESPVGICIIQDGKFCYTNPAFQRNTGYREDELLGRDSLEIVVPEDREHVRENAIKMLKGELTSPHQFRVMHKDSSMHWVVESVASVQYRGRRAVLANLVDITEHKQTEETLQAERNKLQSIIDAMQDELTIQDTEYNIIFQNEPAKINSGGDHVGEKCYRVYERRESICEDCPVEKAFKNGKPHTTEKQQVLPSGEISLLENTANPIRDAAGKVVACLEIGRNITERKQVDEVLQGERNKLQSLVDAMEDGLTIQDRDYNIIYEGRLQRTILGDHLGEKCYRVYEGREKVCKGCPVEKAFKDGKSHTAERRMVEPSGEISFWENTANPIRDASGEIVSCLEINRNITERKKAEEQLQESEQYLKTLFNASGGGILVIDPETHDIVDANSTAIKMIGTERDQLIGRMCHKFVCSAEVGKCPITDLRQKVDSSERILLKANGESMPVIKSVVPITRHGRQYLLELMVDITERKRAEQALADELTQRRLLIDKSLDGIVVLDEDAKVVEANQRFADMLGYTLEEVHELHTWDWDKEFPPEQILEMGRNVDEKGLHLETEHTRKDGSVFDVDISISAAMVGGRKLIFCIDRDITERNRAEQVLQVEKNKLQSVIDAMADTLTIQDTEYNIIFQNEPSKIIYGDHPREKCYRIFAGREKMCDRCPVEEAFKNVKPRTMEKKTVTPSGEVVVWEITANPIRDAGGRIAACLEIGRDVTVRKEQEQALADELTRRRLLVDQSLDGIVVIDENDKVYEANQRFAEMLGYTPEEVRELHTWDWQKIYSREQLHELGRKADEKGFIVETKHTRKDGSLMDVDISINAAMFGGQKLIFCVCRDITERKKAEQALADELTRRRLLVDQSLDGIVVLDVDARVVEANQRFAEMLGYTSEEVRELHTWDWDKNFPPEKLLEMGRSIDEKGLHLETKHTRKDGSVIDVDISINAAMSGEQKLIFCIDRDITERKKMEEALKLAAEEWRETFDSITDAISIHDRDHKILRANKAFADIFHMKPSQLLGKHCYELHKGDKPISGCPHQQTLVTGKPATAEFYEPHIGSYLLESTSPIFDREGEVIGTVHITRDITERKQQNERLMMADRLASVGELAAGTAHELNNPLTSVIGFSQLLMEKDIPDDIREDLQLVHSEAQRAAKVTKNLLTFARKQAPVKQLNQINNIIEDVLKLRAYEHKANGIEVKKQLAPDLPEIMVDYFQMQQVFLNLIINAEYFMTEAHKRGTLTITTKKQNGNVRISFADDGPGIPPENLSRIFDPFFTTKGAGKGTGLGLSICHGIVSEHGGQIYVRNQRDKGATIFIELPINNHDHIRETP